MKKTVSWLHLSDLHLCLPKNGSSQKNIMEDLLEELKKEKIQPDFLFFTGDSVFGQLGKDEYSLKEQFIEFKIFIDRVRKSFTPEILNQNVFIIAGNHDIDRKKVGTLLNTWAKNTNEDTVLKTIKNKSPEFKIFMGSLDEYTNFIRNSYPHLVDEEGSDKDRLIYGITRDVNDLKIGIAGFNSSWACGDLKRGEIWLGGSWQTEELYSKVRNCDLKIALIHHPIDWFKETEFSKNIEKEFQDKFDFHLQGHLHDNHIVPIGDKNKHLQLYAGATFRHSLLETMGYNLVDIDFDSNSVEVHLKKYENSQGGFIPYVIKDKTDNNGIYKLDDFFNKNTTSQPIATPEERGIYGRKNDIVKLEKIIKGKSVITIYGLQGVGKTKLIDEVLSHKFLDYKRIPISIHKKTTLNILYKEIVSSLEDSDTLVEYREFFGKRDFSKLKTMKNVSNTIIHIERGELLFNNKGNFKDEGIKEFFQELIENIPNIKVIFETRYKPKNIFTSKYQDMKISGINKDSLTDFIKNPFPRSDIEGWELDNDEIDFIFEKLGGKDSLAYPMAMTLLANLANIKEKTPYQIMYKFKDSVINKLEAVLFHELYDDGLDDKEKHTLSLCSLYENYIPSSHLKDLEERIKKDGVINILSNRSIINYNDNTSSYSVHLVIKDLCVSRIDKYSQEYLKDNDVIAESYMDSLKNARTDNAKINHASNALNHFIEAENYLRITGIDNEFIGVDTISKLNKLSTQYNELKKYKENYNILKLLVKLAPQSSKYNFFYARAIENKLGKGNLEALNYYKEGYRLDTQNPKNLLGYGNSLISANREIELIDIIDNLDENTKKRVMNKYNLANYCKALEKIDKSKASEIRQKEIANKISDAVFYTDEALYQKKLGNTDLALEILAKTKENQCENEFVISTKCIILEKTNPEEASKTREDLISKKTKNVFFYTDEAVFQFNVNKDIKKALSILEKAEDLGISNEHTLALKCLILEKDEPYLASEIRNEQIENNSKNPAFYSDEAKFQYKINKDKNKALWIIDKAVNLGIADEVIRTLKKQLQ